MDHRRLLVLLDVELSAARTYGWACSRLATTNALRELEAARHAHEQRAQRLRDVLGAGDVPSAASCWTSVVEVLEGRGCDELAAVAAFARQEALALGRYREALAQVAPMVGEDPAQGELARVLRDLCPEQEQTHARLRQLSTML